MDIYQKPLLLILVLTAVGCGNDLEPKDKKTYKAIELLGEAQKKIIKSTTKRVVFKNEKVRTYTKFSVACGEYGVKQNFLDNNLNYSRYIILEKDKLMIEKETDEKYFSATWDKYCHG